MVYISTGNVLKYNCLQWLTAETCLEEDLLAISRTLVINLERNNTILCTDDISTIKQANKENRNAIKSKISLF